MTSVEKWNVAISLSTPILVLIMGFIIAKKMEKNKLEALKEKEWQVKWAEMFLNRATTFNENITLAVCALFKLQNESNKDKINDMYNILSSSFQKISEIDWDIQNYSQFSKKYCQEVLTTQKLLIESIQALIKNKQGDLEKVRILQFNFNEAVRKAHSDILKIQ